MKSYRKELFFEVPTRRAFITITPQVEECLGESGIKRAWCSAIQSTCSLSPVSALFMERLTIEKNQSGMQLNILDLLYILQILP